MKKAVILIAVLSFIAIACSSTSSPDQNQGGNESENQKDDDNLSDTPDNNPLPDIDKSGNEPDAIVSDEDKIEPDTIITDEDSVPNDETPSDADPVKDFAGVYAEKVTITTLDKLPGVGDVETTSSYYGINTIKNENGKYISTSISCRSESAAKGAVFQTIIPDIVVQCIPPLVGELTVTEESGTIKIDKEETVMPVGVKLDDPWNDPLPDDPNDSRIWDQDGDGKPGVTIEVKASGMTGKIYTIRKERGLWSAAMTIDGGFSGLFTDKSEQKTVGADPALFNINPESKPHPDPSKSTINLTKLNGDYDCPKLIEEFETIFDGTF